MWINGETVGEGRRSCGDRYQSIAKKLGRRKNFTILDIGAHSAYFSVRLAEEFQATATAVDGNPDLVDALANQNSNRVRGIFEYADEPLLKSLGSFDVGLCLSVLHHVDWWPTMLQMLHEQCSMLFVELAAPEEASGAHAQRLADTVERVVELGGRLLSTSPSFDGNAQRPLYLIGTR